MIRRSCHVFIEADEHTDIKQFKTMDQFKEHTGPRLASSLCPKM